ncbi:MAG: ATP-binding protein [Romboutsia sp.]
MDSLGLRKKSISKLWYFLVLLSLFILLIISYKDSKSYEFIVIIIKSSLSSLIIMFMVNSNEWKFRYINFIGLGYVASNIYSIVSMTILQESLFSTNVVVVTYIVESIGFLVAIKYLYQKRVDRKSIIPIIVIGGLFLLSVIVGFIFKIKDISVFVAINILLLIYIAKETINYKDDDYKKELKEINRILMLKILYLIFMFLPEVIQVKQSEWFVFLDVINIVQIFLVYKVTIYFSLVNPYISIEKTNIEIEYKSLIEEKTNNKIAKINKNQEDINKELEYKKDFLDSILESTPNGIAIFDEYGNFKECNRAFKDIIEYNGDVNNNIIETIVDSKKFKMNISRVCREKIQLEEELKLRNGSIYKCSYYINYEDGGCVCILLDITEERQILTHLTNLKDEYEDLITNIKLPVFILDEDFNVINFSREYKNLFDKIVQDENTDSDKLIRLSKKVHKDDMNYYLHALGINNKAKNNEELHNKGAVKFRIVNDKDEILWIESRSKICHEENKQYIIKSYEEITEYMNTKHYLEETQNMYKSILNSIPEGIYLEDLDTNKYLFVNKKFRSLFNIEDDIKVENLKCRHDLIRVHKDYEYIVNEVISRIKANKTYNYRDIKYLDRNNSVVDAKFASIPFKIQDKTFKLSIIKDMKDIKTLEHVRFKIEERTKRDSMKMEFFINMSHELKTPLNLIFTSTQLIENLYNKQKFVDLGSKLSNHIKLTKQNSYRLLKIISDLMDFTKMESGFYKIRMENRNIVDLVENISMSVIAYAKNKGIDIIFDTDIEELVIAVDINAVERIILNILSNAIKFTGPLGNIYVTIRSKNDKVDIIIEDTGIGIKEDCIDLIFDRFNDVNKGFSGNIYGSGIGLSMVKSMANLLDANVKVESEYGKGTKFTITLDIKQVDENQSDILEAYKYQKISNVERLTIDMSDIYR